MRFLTLLLLGLFCATADAQNVLNTNTPASDPGACSIAKVFVAVVGAPFSVVGGCGIAGGTLHFDYNSDGTNVAQAVSDATNGAATMFNLGTGASTNNTPYALLVSQFETFATFDANWYTALQGGATKFIQVMPYSTSIFVAGTFPPVSAASVSSPNSADCAPTGSGIEFGLSVSYLGLSTADCSHDSGILGGLFEALEYNHGSWNWFDVKAVLRQTTASWSTGYNASNYGYGIVNYTAANAYAGTIYLQSPGMYFQNTGYSSKISIFPFRQTRRSYEVLCSYSGTAPTSTTEYTTAQFNTACGTVLYSTMGVSAVQPTFTYAPLVSGTVTFVAFTTDGAGQYSRLESFSPMTVTYTIGAACLR